MTPAIAIVGMACRYPDARSPDELWENVLAQRRAFRRIPAERLRLEDYWTRDRTVPDSIYATDAAVLEGWVFDRERFRVAGRTFRAADLAHWLALDVADRALAHAGFDGGAGLPLETTGVVVGNTLTGEFSRAATLRLRWPYVRRVVDAELAAGGMAEGERRALVARIEAAYKQPFEPVGEETLAGGLSNTIAGRICNHFDMKGGGYTVDGACAASLLAVVTACQALESGDLDVALAGGVDLSLDPFELVGFAKTGALAEDEMRVYDERSQGFSPGEGCGIVVLMREPDARAQGRDVIAVIRGWGVSSDGSGGITRPEVDGQRLAIARAYRRAGFGAHTVAYFEGHGTGTVVGDATELQVLAAARRESGDAPPAAIGSVKAIIGHTKAAAGIAGLLKAALALRHQVLPPTVACERPHRELARPDAVLRALPDGAAWPADRPLRAGVSAMGFGGINTHVVMEGVGARPAALPERARVLIDSRQDAELFTFAAATREDLARRVARVRVYAARLSRAELADLAATLAGDTAEDHMRAAVVAATPAELERGLATLAEWNEAGETRRIDTEAGVFLGGAGTPRIAFLFSGQASPVHLAGGALARRFPAARERYTYAGLPESGDAVATALAQPAIVTASLAGLAALDALGVAGTVAVGHSLGELSALHWAGAMDVEAVLEVARVRGRAMMATPGPPSGMRGIAAPADAVAEILAGTGVVVAGLNVPSQTVVSGDLAALAEIETRARARGWRVVPLPVSHAFHSPLMLPAAGALADQLRRTALGPLEREVVSTITGAPLAADVDVTELLVRQLTAPVRFMDAVRAVGNADLVIEVGPGQVLAGLAAQLVAGPVVTLDVGAESLRGVLLAAGAAFALGAPVRAEALFTDRFVRPFALDWSPRFLANPCESAPAGGPVTLERALPHDGAPESPASAVNGGAPRGDADTLTLVRRLLAERIELPIESVRPECRLLDDLHMNSIAVGQLVASAAHELGLKPSRSPTEYADATVAEIARALDERLRSGDSGAEAAAESPAGIEAWIRAFTVEHVARAPRRPRHPSHAPRSGNAFTEPRDWRVLAPASHPLGGPLARAFADVDGRGVVVCLPSAADDAALDLLLEGARAVLDHRPRGRFVVVQEEGRGGGFARSLHLEAGEGATCVVEVPFDHPDAVAWIVAEALAAEGYVEARYDAEGTRTEPVLRALAVPETGTLPLGPDDVLLVTGGGKGIAAECALAVARDTGCRLALLGRSDPARDTELAHNLERVSASGVRFVYIPTDVTDADAARDAVRRVVAELGPVTAVLHGAGVNEPTLVRSLTPEALRRTVAAKVRGAENVLAAVDRERLTLFVAFGSIIARTGLRGEADYALANEWLTRLTERLAGPMCRALAIEWSVWSGVGMGERLGRVDTLVGQGVTPIGVDQGVAWFRRLLAAPAATTSVVVSGRPVDLPTLRVEPAELPLFRFLERPRVHVPGIELVADADLSPEADPYLEDHVYGGTRLFPAVMGLEAMAQVVMALTGTMRAPRFENVRFDRPVAIPVAGSTTIRVAALVREPGVVDVALRCRETGFEVDHFVATCRIGSERVAPTLEVAAPGGRGASAAASDRVALEPERDLYGGLLFHRGRFRRLGGYRRLRATECVAEISADGETQWFGRYLPAGLVLGDPGAHDGAIHAVQACIPHATLLPVAVDRVTFDPLPAHEPSVVEAREVGREGPVLVYQVEVRDTSGAVRERWDGLRLRIVGDAAWNGPWPAALLAPHIERRLAELVPGTAARVALIENGAGARRAHTDDAIRTALGRAGVVRRRLDGKPEVDAGHVSAAHAGALTLAMAGERALGCDVETIVGRTSEEWQALLGADRWSLALRAAREARESDDAAATRVWSVMECAKKAGFPAEALRLGATAPGGWVVFHVGRHAAATLATSVRGVEGALVLAGLTTSEAGACAPTNTGT